MYKPSSGDTNWVASVRRVMDVAWWGKSAVGAKAPAVLNNESIDALNAAGTGVVPLIKADASNNVVLLGGDGNQRFLPSTTQKTIVNGSATSLFDVACANNAQCSGTFFYHVFAADGTNYQAMTGMVSFSAVNKAGTITAAVGYATGNDAKAVSSGTLTLSFTAATGTNKITVKLQPTGSLTVTTFYVMYTVFPIVGAITLL